MQVKNKAWGDIALVVSMVHGRPINVSELRSCWLGMTIDAKEKHSSDLPLTYVHRKVLEILTWDRWAGQVYSMMQSDGILSTIPCNPVSTLSSHVQGSLNISSINNV